MKTESKPADEQPTGKKPYRRPEILGKELLEVMAVECLGGTAKTIAMPATCLGPIGS